MQGAGIMGLGKTGDLYISGTDVSIDSTKGIQKVLRQILKNTLINFNFKTM